MNSPDNANRPNKCPLPPVFIRFQSIEDSPGRDIPLPQAAVRAPCHDPRVLPLILVIRTAIDLLAMI
jgi:hypothetical protein